MVQRIDFLSAPIEEIDPSIVYKMPTPYEELARESHDAFMRDCGQEEWLKKIFRRSDQMKADQERVANLPKYYMSIGSASKPPKKKRGNK